MASRNNDTLGLLAAERERQKKKDPEGIIVAVRLNDALVQPLGSTGLIPCAFDAGQGIAVNKRCTYRFIPLRKRYVIQTIFGANKTIVSPDQNPAAFELAPPSGLSASRMLPGCITLTWNCPPQQDITFEVQTNSAAVEAGATTVGRTRAGLFLIEAEALTYTRVRSITEDWRYSSWSAWIAGTPGAVGASGQYRLYTYTVTGGVAELVTVDDEVVYTLEALE